MKANKFTAGPWAIDPASDTAIAIHAPDGDKHICVLDERDFGDEPDQEEQEARREHDARLIAAAPDLLAACRIMAERFLYHNPGGTTKEQGEALAKARAAIAKAEGAS